MLRVFKSSFKIIWANGKKEKLYYHDLLFSSIPILSEEALDEEVWDIKEFADAYDFFHKHSCFYKYFSTVTLFNKPIIYTPEKTITVKNFEPFKVIKTYEDITEKVSIKKLAEELNADDFCRFLRDRQVSFSLDLTK